MGPQANCPCVSLPFSRPGFATGPEAQGRDLGVGTLSKGLAASVQHGVLTNLGHLPVFSGLGKQPVGLAFYSSWKAELC